MRAVRIAVVVLLFVNLVFMAWAHFIDAPAEAAVNQADARLPRLALASEVAAQPAVAPREAAAAPAPAPANAGSTATETPAAKRCVSVGPFNDVAQETRAATLLQERGFAPQQRTEAADVRDGYWVYLGGLKSAADEAKALRSLQEAGITDARAVPAADDGRRVSVGLFTERPRAEKRARAVQHLGFSPDIVERRRPGTIYWIDLDLGTSDAAVPTEGLASPDQGESRIQVRVCP
jgi:cell division septation protein DedD